MGDRLDWDTTWLVVADTIGKRSRCSRRGIGAVLVSPKQRIVATGYNGPPAGLELDGECSGWCARASEVQPGTTYANCLSVHAEVNALIYADRNLYEGGTMYVTGAVCWDCAKIVANSGVKRVVMVIGTDDKHRAPDRSINLLKAAGIEVDGRYWNE